MPPPLTDEIRHRRAVTFDTVAETYDRTRREYPDQLFIDLFAESGIKARGADILEIGCGTGQATLPLARHGCRVVCIEMGASLACILRDKTALFPGVTVINAKFEDWDARGAIFDLVFAANSWHWMDPQVRYQKAASLLRPDGVLAYTIERHAFPPGFDSFFTEIQACYEEIGAGYEAWPPPQPDNVPDAREEIERTGLFRDVRVVRRLWTLEFTADEYVALMNTASDHRLFEPAKRERLFSEMRRLIEARPGGKILKHNLTILHVARKKAQARVLKRLGGACGDEV